MALRDYITGAFLAFAALRGNTQFKLNIVETHARAHVAKYLAVGNALADTHNHGATPFLTGWLKHMHYKCEFLAFATLNFWARRRPGARYLSPSTLLFR